MSNTPEQNKVAELMKPRYKVIADFPDSINPVGTVLICRAMNDPDKWSARLDKYPAIYKRLEWWEDRKPEEMPECLKETEDSLLHIYKHRTDFKYLSAIYCIGMRRSDDKRMIHLQYLQPATQSEYDQYIKQKL